MTVLLDKLADIRCSKFQLLNTDDHIHILKKSGRDSTEPRPDILLQVGVVSHAARDAFCTVRLEPRCCVRNGRSETAHERTYMQCLLTLLDSPLNKAGKLQVVFVVDGLSVVECRVTALLWPPGFYPYKRQRSHRSQSVRNAQLQLAYLARLDLSHGSGSS